MRRFVQAGVRAFVVAAVFAVLALYFLMWAWSSASLAFVDCSGKYSFLVELAPCRTPAWVSALFAGFTLVAVSSLFVGFVQRKRFLRSKLMG